MKKIATLFIRNRETWQVEPEVTPGCEWVLRGEGRPTRKVDGTAMLIRSGQCYKRREVKPGRERPPHFVHVETDDTTSREIGWVPIKPADPGDRYFAEGIKNAREAITPTADGATYELVGPKVQRNTEGLERHEIVAHESRELHLDAKAIGIDGLRASDAFHALDNYLRKTPHEGIVWHHPDGRRAKIKRRDFGHRWPIASPTPRKRRSRL